MTAHAISPRDAVEPMVLRTASLRVALTTPPLPGWHVISIASDAAVEAALPPGWDRVTYVVLSDTAAPDARACRRIAHAALTARHAGAVGLLVHCEMGLSRSVGVARALVDVLGCAYDSSREGNPDVRRLVAEQVRHLQGQDGGCQTLHSTEPAGATRLIHQDCRYANTRRNP